MSIRVMTLVWDRSDLMGAQLLALLAIADNANEEGVAWPSQEYLAIKTRQSDRNIRRVLDRVIAKGELTLEESGTFGRSNRYRVNLEALMAKKPKMSALRPVQGGHLGTDDDGSPGQQMSVLGGHQMSDEPSTEPSEVEQAKEEPTLTDVEKIWTRWETTFEGRVKLGLTERRRGSLTRALKAVDGDVDICLRAIAGFKFWLDQHPDRNQKADIGRVFETGMHDTKNLTDKILGWAEDAPDVDTSNVIVPTHLKHAVTQNQITVARFMNRTREIADGLEEEAAAAATWLRVEMGIEAKRREDGTIQWSKISDDHA